MRRCQPFFGGDHEGFGVEAEEGVGVVREVGEARGVFDGGVVGHRGQGGIVGVAEEPGGGVAEGCRALHQIAEEHAEAVAAAGGVGHEGVRVVVHQTACGGEAFGVEAVEVHHAHAGEGHDVGRAMSAVHGGGGGEGGQGSLEAAETRVVAVVGTATCRQGGGAQRVVGT